MASHDFRNRKTWTFRGAGQVVITLSSSIKVSGKSKVDCNKTSHLKSSGPNISKIISNKQHRDETTKDNKWSRRRRETKISVITRTFGGKSLVSRKERKEGRKEVFDQSSHYIVQFSPFAIAWPHLPGYRLFLEIIYAPMDKSPSGFTNKGSTKSCWVSASK